MDFRSMKRKDLQSLCKKYSIPANLSNLDMANKLSELFEEKEKPLIRGLSCLKGPDVNVSETESDVVENKKAKKVRFSPEHELIEFTRSRKVKGRRTRKSMLRDNSLAVENVNTEKSRGRKLAKIDDIKDIVASIDVETEKVCEKKVNTPDRVMRSRRQTLVDLLVNENDRGRIGVDNNVVLANVEHEESRVNRRALRNRKMVGEGVKENVKEKEEVLENKEIVEENVNIESQIVLRRSKRNAKKVEDEGARKYEIDGRRCLRKKHNELALEASKFDADSATETKVEVEGRLEVEEVLHLEDPAKVQSRRSNRRKNTTDSNERMENDEPVAENKERYQLSTTIETGISSVVPKEDVKVSHITGVTRRSRRRTMISQSVLETHKKLDDKTIEKGELREPTREPCLVEEGPVREENTRRSRRIASKHEPTTKMDGLDGKVNVPGKNEARKRKRVLVSGEDVIKAEDAIASEKAARMAVKGKVAQKRKQSSRVEKPSLVEASLLDMSSIPESSAVDAQLTMPQVVDITTNAAFSCTGIDMNITSNTGQTSGTEAHGNIPDTSVEVSAGSFDAREVNGPELENRENSSLSKNVIMHFDNPECDLEISVGKSREVVDNFHVPLEIAVENSFEDNICNSNMDESESMNAELHKSPDKTVSRSVNVVDHAVEHEVDIVQDNLDRVELEVVNELTSTIHSCPSDVDHLAASNQRFEEDDEDTATKATEEGVLDTCGETVNKTSIQENKYAQDPGFYIEPVAETSFETNISSRIHCSDHTEVDANSMKSARILEERELSLSQDSICADTDNGIIGEDTFLHDQNTMESAKIGEGELSKKYEVFEPCYGEKSNTAIPEDNIIEDPGKFASAGAFLGINNFSSGDQLDVAEEDIVAFGLEGASEQKKQPLDMLREDQEAYDVTDEDKTFVQEENLSDLVEIVKDDCLKNHETAPEISISNLFDGEKSARTICDGEDSFKNANMHCKIADSPVIASPAMFEYSTEINTNGSSSCSKEASLFRPNIIQNSLGNVGLEAHNEEREDGTYSTMDLYTENSVSIIRKDALVGSTVDSEKIYASVNEDNGGEETVAVGSGEETWSKQSNANGIKILQPISCSQQVAGPAAVDDDISFLLTTPLKGRDANTPVGVLKSLLSTHVDAENSIQEEEASSIGSKTAGFATSVHKIVNEADEGTHTEASESCVDDEIEPGLLVNLFATPVGIANAIRKKEAWSMGSKAAGDTKSLDKTSGKGADKSSNEDKNENQLQNPFNLPANNANPSEGQHAYDPAEVLDVAISKDFACNEVEFECQFGLATGSMDSEKINASVSEDITGKEIDTNRIETLHPINGAQQGPATTDGELISPFAAHGDANTIPEHEDLSTGSKTAGEAMSLESNIREGDYGILGQVNENPEDDANQPGLLISLFTTPVGNANTIQKKEAWSTGSKAAGDTMSLDRTTSKGADESNKDKNESHLQKSFNLPANNAKPSEERHDQNPGEIVDVTIPMGIACTKREFQSHFGLTTEIMDSEKIDASVNEDIREEIDAPQGESIYSGEEIDAQQAPAAADSDLKSPFATRVGYANTIQENEALSIGSETAAEATSVCSTISKGENGILRQENDSLEDDANEPGLLKSLVDTPVGVVNATQENEAWRIGSIAAGNTMFLEKTGSKGELEFFSKADDSFSKDRSEIGGGAISKDSACNKMGFESFIQIKSHKTEEEECRIQIEHAGNMVSYDGNEFNNLFGTPIDRTNHGPPNETSSHGTEIADLTMSAEENVSKMVSAESFDRNFQETEGEKGSKNEKTVQKCAVQQTPEQLSETSSDVGSEEDQLKVLFATPVNSATPCKENETSGSNASAAEQNANSEMVMEQSAVFQDLNERSNNSETQRITTVEANEMHTTFQNEDNIDADYGAKSPLLSYLEMHVPLKENKEMENSEADTSNFNLVHDHLKNSEEVEENSTTMLIKQQVAMPDHQSEDDVELRSSSLGGSVLPVSGCHETLKESDVADTIKAYIDSESTILVGVDDLTHVAESIDNELSNLVEAQIQSHVKPVNADEENDKHTIESKTREVEEMQLDDSACESKEADADLGIDGANNALITRKKSDLSWWDIQNDSHGKGSTKQHSIAKNVRTILIHGTPNKAITRGNMKENAPDSKRDNIGNLTTVRPAKRRALQDLQWK